MTSEPAGVVYMKGRTRRKADDCEECFYCGTPLDVIAHEHDHAPIPQSAGGKAVVPACTACHDRKDRCLLDDWDAHFAWDAVTGLVTAGLARYPFLVPASTDWPDQWDTLPSGSRLMWARLTRSAWEKKDRDGRDLVLG